MLRRKVVSRTEQWLARERFLRAVWACCWLVRASWDFVREAPVVRREEKGKDIVVRKESGAKCVN